MNNEKLMVELKGASDDLKYRGLLRSYDAVECAIAALSAPVGEPSELTDEEMSLAFNAAPELDIFSFARIRQVIAVDRAKRNHTREAVIQECMKVCKDILCRCVEKEFFLKNMGKTRDADLWAGRSSGAEMCIDSISALLEKANERTIK